jgi:hypothetical protein
MGRKRSGRPEGRRKKDLASDAFLVFFSLKYSASKVNYIEVLGSEPQQLVAKVKCKRDLVVDVGVFLINSEMLLSSAQHCFTP